MALFSKKTCSVCGKPTGSLVGYPIKDGMVCGECRDRCSPHLPPLRSLTVEQVKKHLQYRERNAAVIESYRPDLILGMGRGLQVTADTEKELFAVAVKGNIYDEQADVFRYDQVKVLQMDEVSSANMPETRVFRVLIESPESGIDAIKIPETACTSQTFAAMWDFFKAILEKPFR